MGAFSIVAEGGAFKLDRDEVRRAARILFSPGEWHELRALPSAKARIIQGGDLEAIVTSTAEIADQSVYYCLNPIAKGAERAKKTTVVSRRWFALDIDTVHPKDVSATEAEKAKSAEVAHAIFEHLFGLGWPAPVMIDSGNGWHLLFRVDEPHTDLTTQIFKSAIYALGNKFDTPFGKMDRAVHDAPRVFKLPGTFARKGPDTADRPWRLAKIVYEPETIECVSIDLIKSLGGKSEDDLPPHEAGSPWATTATAKGQSLEAYVRSAIERECGKIALSVERNNALNTAAFSLGTMAAWPEMLETVARDALKRAACQSGLDRDDGCGLRGIEKTIESGWSSGAKNPRVRPIEQVTSPIITSDTRLVTFGHEVESKKVNWLWQNRIAEGFISIFAGKTGIGKSFVLCDLTARLTAGRAFPEEATSHLPANVLFISEDSIEYVLAPRLLELGGAMHRVAFMNWEAMARFTLGNIDMLEEVYRQSGSPKLIIFDPPSNFLGGKDEHKNAEVRSVVMKVIAWLDVKRAAAVFVTHINRRLEKGVEALDRIMGSVAWGTTARVAIGFTANPDKPDQCLCAGIKNNVGVKAATLAYEIRKTDALAIVEWQPGAVDISADEAMSKTKKGTRRMNAEEFLTQQFRIRETWPSEEIIKLGKEAGVSRNALFEAKGDLPISAKQMCTQDGTRFWEWRANEGWPPPEEKNVQNSETLGLCERKSLDDNTYNRVPIDRPY